MLGFFDRNLSREYRSDGAYRTEQRRRSDCPYDRQDRGNHVDYEEPEGSRRRNDDEYLLDEIARLKAETGEIRQILRDRQIQIDELETQNNAAILKIADKLKELSEQLEDAEDAITDAIARNRDTIKDEVARANKPLEEKYRALNQELTEKLGALKLELVASSDKLDAAKATVDGLSEALEEKAEKKSVAALHRRFTTMFAVGVVNLVGTIMTLALLCYLIISLAR